MIDQDTEVQFDFLYKIYKNFPNVVARSNIQTDSLAWKIKSQNPKTKTIYIESFEVGNIVIVNAFDATKSQILNTTINVTSQNREHKFPH